MEPFLIIFSQLWKFIFGIIGIIMFYIFTDMCIGDVPKKTRRTIWAVILTTCLLFSSIFVYVISYDIADAKSSLSEKRVIIADQIADICIEEWDTYGRLPSIAVGQAFVESGFTGPNLFGVRGDKGKSVVSSTYGYLNCLNNEYFRGEGAFIFDREDQLSIIIKGGRYCEGEYSGGSYYSNVLSSIYKYGWEKYDDILTKRLDIQAKLQRQAKARRTRKQHQREAFRLHGDESVPVGTCVCDPAYIKRGSVVVVNYAILECTKTKKGLGNTILIHSCEPPMAMGRSGFRGCGIPTVPVIEIPKECKDEVYLTEVIEDAKG